ncbi:MAG: hypothetical protein AMJ81_06835 [Phycisphaerae bacterium SM23_33]|nr:MAG: hypothetical protein AMJ81_06835 [Phycisphaerae bacterium SM23_33]
MTGLFSMTMLAGVPDLGGYFSILKIIVILPLLLPWLYAATWMNKDTARVRTVGQLWLGLTLGAGVLGVLLWLVVPYFLIGAVLYLGLTAGVIGVYVGHRNKRVVSEAKVLTAEHIRAVLSRRRSEKVEVMQRVKLYDCYRKAVFPPEEEATQERRAYNAVQELLQDVVLMRASQADLSAAGPQTAVRFVVDGVLQNRPPLDRAKADLLVDFIRGIAGMKPEDKRHPQEGKISLDMGAMQADVDVLAAGTAHGQRLQLRVLQESIQTKLEELGMPDSLYTRLVEISAEGKGLVIVSGPKGNGVTSTLYSLLRKHDAYLKALGSLERSPEVDLENVSQQSYADANHLADRLASMLRRDPDVVMVDQCETTPAAELVCEAAAAKSMLLGAVADNVFVALARWIKVCGDRERALACLKAVTCQKLLRKLCPKCKEAYRPAREMLAKLNLPAEKIEQFYHPPTKPLTDEKGRPIICPTCRGTGYYGRTAAFEMLEMNDEIRQLIAQDAPLSRIKAACRKNGMLYLQEQALRKVISGMTSVEEVIRVSKSK